MTTALVVALIGVVVVVVAMQRHGRQMMKGRPGVVALEVAGTGERMFSLLDALKSDGRARMGRALAIDGWIILGYVMALGGGAIASIWVVRWAADGRWETAGTAIAVAMAGVVAVAAALDLAENAALGAGLDAWEDPPARTMPPDAGNAAARQAHRRAMIAALAAPARRAARAAAAKFALLAASGAWLVLIVTIAITQALS